MFTRGISVYLIVGLTIVNLSELTVGEKERFANFYAAPANLELIAMASENSPHHSQRSSYRDHSHNQHHQQSRHQSQSHPEYRGKSSAPPSRKPSSDYNDEPRFSIGLGTLAPSYSQKFGVDGKTRLDFDHRANGFSYTLTNNHHPGPQEDQQGYEASPQDSKSADANVKIYYDQRFSPYAAAETNNYVSRVPYMIRNPQPYGLRPLQDQRQDSDNSRLSDIFARYAPKQNEQNQEYNEEANPNGGPGGPYYAHGHESQAAPPASGREYHNDMYSPRFDESHRKQGASEFPEIGGSFFESSSDDDGSDGYNYPLPFQKKDSSSFMSSHPEGSLEYISRIAGGPSEFNEFSHDSNPEPVVFSSMANSYSGLDSNDAFSAYIAGLPLTP
ncbi:uncharacterized protein LOC107360312 [Tetranychus urticae]|uniref:Uncharacterized protein n=1 Tax=Tetranychus urticae TaxID=32264 RepID=T1K441_TETUR|nr:uncharacterized protein LOC107360312 [Tetranychus urticae]XP_025016276.1 uncharacterized protein LOC107360312 [Tetranychus urticae]